MILYILKFEFYLMILFFTCSFIVTRSTLVATLTSGGLCGEIDTRTLLNVNNLTWTGQAIYQSIV
jgi:hypothetical protein